ncbi:Uncharacterised protein [Neisseria gonorrhoeae]|uniref:Uncharacterized protein n=1 Tax=Neisseria gonorrhoeae TaxID=485 RepID=A0A378VXI7_NEIGO|nr:Uncharacterised protein [Neisseria gonorrhoeae]
MILGQQPFIALKPPQIGIKPVVLIRTVEKQPQFFRKAVFAVFVVEIIEAQSGLQLGFAGQPEGGGVVEVEDFCVVVGFKIL